MRGTGKRNRNERREERRSVGKSLQAATCLFISAVVVVLAPNSRGSPKPFVLTSKMKHVLDPTPRRFWPRFALPLSTSACLHMETNRPQW